MTTAELLRFLKRYKLAVQATTSPDHQPQAAVVGYAVSDAFEFVFDTLDTSRKFRNLRADPRVALVVGWDDAMTAQIEGVADVPTGDELERLKACYFAVYPDGRERLAWAGITHVRVRPTWIRFSDFTQEPPRIVEFDGSQL